MNIISKEDAETVMRFFKAHRQAERLERKASEKSLSRHETEAYIAALELRQALRGAVIEINSRPPIAAIHRS